MSPKKLTDLLEFLASKKSISLVDLFIQTRIPGKKGYGVNDIDFVLDQKYCKIVGKNEDRIKITEIGQKHLERVGSFMSPR